MAFITKAGDSPCYSCGKQCINVEFCSEGATYDLSETNGVSISKNIKVKVLANPDFWGFGSGDDNVLISGWATWGTSYYDFFDGHDEMHMATKTCGSVSYGPFMNEQRPDVFYRTVYDPYDVSLAASGYKKHYDSSGNLDTSYPPKDRGGAEAYLVDRPKSLISPVTQDMSSCDTTNPTQVFKKTPENFGWGNKINLNTKIFKNISGAWRLSSIEQCYDSGSFHHYPGHLLDCSGEPKQNISIEDGRFLKYEPSRLKAKPTGVSNYYNHESGCKPDGAIASEYTGGFTNVSGIYRPGENYFMQAHLTYGDGAASGLKTGMTIGLYNTVNEQLNDSYTIFDVYHTTEYTSVKFVGSQSNEIFSLSGLSIHNGDRWVAFDTYDPETCCSLSAYGVDERFKSLGNTNFHTDFRRILNNPQNIRQSNRDREWRYNYGLFDTIQPIRESGAARVDQNYVSISGGGYPVLNDNGQPIIFEGSAISGSPYLEKQLPYYGPFFEVDACDDAQRVQQNPSRLKNNNATCYSKQATLEIFPDCITQFNEYQKCNTGTIEYEQNRLPRLAFVYRGCDFNDGCSFDESGLPLGGWQNSAPSNMNDLKRQLAGQEIHMFINLSTAWGGEKPGSPCACSCSPPIPAGTEPPVHVEIPSVMTFPLMPNFDINPTGYGCLDARYQLTAAKNYEWGDDGPPDDTEHCDPLHTSEPACWTRQPYTTYGYMMNLCGKENRNRKNVISNAFAKLNQEKTYTNKTPEVDIDEPMYWNVTAPDPAPFNPASGVWSSGTTNRSDGGGDFFQVGGSGYGWWGVADSNKAVVAPYFATECGKFSCCGTASECNHLDYSSSGTYWNTLQTHNGWPTSGVPFFIEWEVDDRCLGCVSANMKAESLHVSFSGLNAEYIWNEADRYGHNYCKYGSPGFKNTKISPGEFTCASGYGHDICATGDELRKIYGDAYHGSTCGCISSGDGFSVTLSPVVAPSSQIVIGWKSSSGRGGDLTEVTPCHSLDGRYLDTDYLEIAGCGHRIFAQVELACPDFHQYLTDPSYPEAKYGDDPISALWGGTSSCQHHYPARVGGDGDLDLKTTLYAVSPQYQTLFNHITSQALQNLDLTDCLSSGHFIGGFSNGIFGFCQGDKIYKYGCELTASNGSKYFYGCTNPVDPLENPCLENTLCNTCPTGVDLQVPGSGGIECICNEQVGFEGTTPGRAPAEYQLNECYCDCKDPTLFGVYEIAPDNSGLILVSGDPSVVSCARDYWWGGSGANGTVIGPTLLGCLPPCPHLGVNLGSFYSSDWWEWNHGINGMVTGIQYELNEPYIGGSCNQMSKGLSPGSIVECEVDCDADANVGSKSCGNPIYHGLDDYELPFLGVNVRKKRCAPEVAIVNKIECIPIIETGIAATGTGVAGSGLVSSSVGYQYKLYVSREYHEHDRTWKEQIVDDGGNLVCVPVAAGAYSGVNLCHTIPYALEADTVTPAYQAPCSIHPSSGVYVTQDYQLDQVIDDSGNAGYTPVWNYFNLFYSSGHIPSVTSGNLIVPVERDSNGQFTCSGSAMIDPASGTILETGKYYDPSGFYGIFETNKKHSCVQDSIECGGELWCNKMLFPRHNYIAGTKIAPFAAPSVCTSNSQFKSGYGFDGYTSQGEGDSLNLEQTSRFRDWCDDEVLATAQSGIDIDDVTIIVDDYLPLMGVIHPGWRFTSDVKNCTLLSSGCMTNIPTHTEHSILAGLHAPKTYIDNGFESMGYYLDRFGVSLNNNGSGLMRAIGYPASGDHECLFNPFKIMLDVECSTNRIARYGITQDPPTYLKGVQEWPATACLGNISEPACICSDSQCSYAVSPNKGECTKFRLATYVGTTGEVDYVCPSSYIGGPGMCPDDYCTSGVGPFILSSGIVGKWIHPDHLEDISLSGTVQSPAESGECYVSGSGASFFEYSWGITEVESGWMKNKCDGHVYKIEDTGWAKIWQCGQYQYLGVDPQGGTVNSLYLDKCDCETDWSNGLCWATKQCVDFATCDCSSFVSDAPDTPPLTPNSGWWTDDCGCEAVAKSEAPCTNSRVMFEITEIA